MLSLRFLKGSIVILILAMLGGCPFPDCCGPEDDSYYDEPIYLSYNDLRNSIQVEPARKFNSIGRIYLYNNYFFVNEKNKGIHVYDNSDPFNPRNTSFLSIPGNTELSIRDRYLYADSYVDLVTLDLNNLDNIQVVDRKVDVFPWNAYQNVSDNVRFSNSQLDETRGVVVGYE